MGEILMWSHTLWIGSRSGVIWVPNNWYPNLMLGSCMLDLLYGVLTLFRRVCLFIFWPKGLKE